jgi:hypothetical protein
MNFEKLTAKQKELFSLWLRLLEIDYLKKFIENKSDVYEIAYIQLLYKELEK